MRAARHYLSILRIHPRPGRFLLSRLLRDSGLWRFFTLRMDGYKLRLHPAALSVNLFVNKHFRRDDEQVIRRLLPDAGTYVDVGANIGQLAICARRVVGDKGLVIAVEPHPRTAAFLRANLQFNGISDVRVLEAAAGDRFGFEGFADRRDDDQNSVVQDDEAEAERILVPIVRLGPFLAGLSIDLLKIDVEGYEKFVLDGLGDALDGVRHIYLEASDEHFREAGYLFRDIHGLLSARGFSLMRIKSGVLAEVVAEERFPHTCNIFASRDLLGLMKALGLGAA